MEGDSTYVSAPVAGKLEKLMVHRGDTVKKDQTLAILDQEPLLDDLNIAKAALEQSQATLEDLLSGEREPKIKALDANVKEAQAKLDYARVEMQRFNRLLESKSTDQNSVDQAVSNANAALAAYHAALAQVEVAKLPARAQQIAAAKAQVAQSSASVSKANWSYQQTHIKAPVAGLVDNRFYTQGEWIAAYQPIVSILAKENIKVLFFVPEADLSQLKYQQEVTLHLDGSQAPLKAKISFIAPQAEYTPPVIYSVASRQKLVYRIEARLDSAQYALHPGQIVDVSLGA